jgi:hypothetical protein
VDFLGSFAIEPIVTWEGRCVWPTTVNFISAGISRAILAVWRQAVIRKYFTGGFENILSKVLKEYKPRRKQETGPSQARQ